MSGSSKLTVVSNQHPSNRVSERLGLPTCEDGVKKLSIAFSDRVHPLPART